MFDWQLKAFNDLSVTELYAIIQLREQIFILEQSLGENAVIATTNVKHLSLFSDAREWTNI